MQYLLVIFIAYSLQGVNSEQNDEQNQVIARLRPPKWKDGRKHFKIPHSNSQFNRTNEILLSEG